MDFTNLSLRRFLRAIYAVLIIFGALFVLDFLVCLPIYLVTKNGTVLFIATLIAFGIMLVLLVGIIVSGTLMNNVFYQVLFSTTRNNLLKFIDGKKNFDRYESKMSLQEFKELNDKLDILEDVRGKSMTSYAYNDYTHLGIQFIDPYYTVATYESLKNKYKDLIYASRAYRNAFIRIAYDSSEEIISQQDVKRIINSIKENFKYNKILIGVDETGKKYLVYVPCIDTINALKGELEQFQTSTSISVSGVDGLTLMLPKITVVIYPYSAIDEIISDLRYASRQGQLLNIYLPNKLFLRANDNSNDLAISVNNINKFIQALSTISTSPNVEKDREVISETLTRLSGFLAVDEAGVILYRQAIDKYVNVIDAYISDDNKIFGLDKHIPFGFIDAFKDILDEDGTYYFSNRSHCNGEITKYFDIYGIKSGFFYFIRNNEQTLGVIYLINKSNSMLLDSYTREALFVISTIIDHSMKNRIHQEQIEHMRNRIDDVSKLSNLRLYTVERDTFDLKDFSATMQDRNKNIEVGQKCYKCIYGKDSPCKDCPILTNKKKTVIENDLLYETSTVLTKTTSTEIDLLISLPNDSLDDHNRFNTEYLTNSFFSFLDRLKTLYLERSKGYIITLTIDNYEDINSLLGPEQYSLYIRKFVSKATRSINNVRRIYSYHENTFMIVLPESGRVDVCDVVETLYTISKSIDESNNEVKTVLNISYDAIKYPQTFDNERDLMAHIDKFLSTKHHKVTDQLFLEESDYFRPASRTAFILDTIENAVKNNTFIIRMQPVVLAANKRMSGAEILIRLNDDNRNLLFNTFEMIKVAGDNNKIGIISDLLINFIGDTYAKYGLTLFKQYGFNRISLNTEFSYFSDVEFLDKIENMMKKYYFPKDFLGFEINEKDIFYNFDKFKQLSKAILSNNVTLICDQYSGEFISLDKIKDLGISEIKIGRQKVKNIDTNKDALSEVLSIVDYAKRLNIKTTLVGVESVDQYSLVREANKDVSMQGYYFYQPLDINEMIEALRKSNS